MSDLLVERVDRRTLITLNRPDKANALSPALLTELEQSIVACATEPDVRVIVIRGAGRGFSAGYDLVPSGGVPSEHHNAPSAVTQDVERLRETAQRWLRIFDSAVPTVAQVHGYCLAGGFELAMACDFVIAAEDARFQFAPVRAQGVPPMMFYPWLTSLRRAKEFLWTGDPLSGREAMELGLINRAVPADHLEQVTAAFVDRLALTPTELVTLSKRALHRALDASGFRTAVTSGVEFDALAHQTRSALEFGRIAREDGLKSAVAWRDDPYVDDRS